MSRPAGLPSHRSGLLEFGRAGAFDGGGGLLVGGVLSYPGRSAGARLLPGLERLSGCRLPALRPEHQDSAPIAARLSSVPNTVRFELASSVSMRSAHSAGTL